MLKVNSSTFIGITALFLSTAASAALPTEASSAITAATTAVSDVLTAVWVPIGAVIAGSVIIKLVKRFSNKI